MINLKAPAGTRLEITDQLIAKVEQIVRDVVPRKDLKILVSNIGTTPGFSSIYTPNSGPHTAFVQVGLEEGHTRSSFAYMDEVRWRLREQLPVAERVLSDRRARGCGTQSRLACAHRCAGEWYEHARRA